jgi:GNAT superfamily N-acetyltransferase
MDNKLEFRLATGDDILDIVKMLADDALSASVEDFEPVLPEGYLKAFENIIKDPNQELTIVEMNGEKVATYQLTFIQYLTHQGGLRAQVEAVRTVSKYRGQGIGKRVFAYIIDRAKQRNCNMVQLGTDKKRTEAIRFYENLGFVASHEGLKLKL